MFYDSIRELLRYLLQLKKLRKNWTSINVKAAPNAEREWKVTQSAFGLARRDFGAQRKLSYRQLTEDKQRRLHSYSTPVSRLPRILFPCFYYLFTPRASWPIPFVSPTDQQRFVRGWLTSITMYSRKVPLINRRTLVTRSNSTNHRGVRKQHWRRDK